MRLRPRTSLLSAMVLICCNDSVCRFQASEPHLQPPLLQNPSRRKEKKGREMTCFRDQTGLLSRKALKTRVLGPEFSRKTKKSHRAWLAKPQLRFTLIAH